MEHKHAGKLQQWFPSASWTIVSLDLPECEHLVYLDSDWTKANKLTNQSDGQNYRLLRRVSENAIRLNYFESDDPKCKSHRDYYKLFREGKLNLKDDPVAVCTLNANERSSNPQGTFYIQDGNGRALPYLVLVMEQKIVFEPVHAFLAEQP